MLIRAAIELVTVTSMHYSNVYWIGLVWIHVNSRLFSCMWLPFCCWNVSVHYTVCHSKQCAVKSQYVLPPIDYVCAANKW